MIMEAVTGGIAFLAGVVAISRPTKDLHAAIKYAPLVLCAVGAFNIWEYCTQEIPVVADAKVTVLQVEPQKMYVDVDPKFARKCSLRAVDVYMVDSSKVTTRVPANFVNPKDFSLPAVSQTWTSDSVVEIQANPRDYESFYFVSHDRCAFDIHVRSEFGHTVIPQKFNASAPTGSSFHPEHAV